MTEKQLEKDIQVYKAYMEAHKNRETVFDVADRFDMTRGAVYEAVRRIRQGNNAKIRRGVARAHFNCLWRYRYRPRFLAMPDNQELAEQELVEIIKGMRKDGFPVKQIAERLGKQRQFIYHRLYKHKI